MGTRYQFKGYNTKPDKLLGDGSIASNCNNIVFNRGDLCNAPMSERKVISDPFQFDDENLCTFYNYTTQESGIRKEISALILYNSKGELWVRHGTFDGLDRTQFVKIDMLDFLSIVNFRYPFKQNDLRIYKANNLDTLSGNIVQVGDWLVFLCQTGVSVPTSINSAAKVFPQMFRIRFPAFNQTFPTSQFHYIRSLVGVYQPSAITQNSNASGLVTGTMDFGFSFVYRAFEYNSAGIDNVVEDQESNVTIYGTMSLYTNKSITFRLYLPSGHSTFWSYTDIMVKVYTRLQDQSIYYLLNNVQAFVGANTIFTDATNGKSYILFTINSVLTQDLNHPAPLTSLTPIVGAHDPPKLATHGCYYKGKMYYNCLEVGNLLQISARTPAGTIDTGLYANYIENWEFIGKESSQINGLIEYQGQLIIFQDIETYVLTNDLNSEGEIRILFHDGGCEKGGKAYDVYDEKLWYGNRKGIFVYDGSSEPLYISGAIQKDLEKISRLRYQYMRISHDQEHKLIMVNFPWGQGCTVSEEVPTFVFHTKESGYWTKIESISDILNDKFCNQDPKKQFNILYNSRRSLRLIKSIDESIETTSDGQSWTWSSSFFDVSTPTRFKHWKWLMLETIPELSKDFNITVEFFNEKDQSMDLAMADIADVDYKKFRRISGKSKQLWFRLSGTTKKAFRLTSFELNGHISTRRR